MFKILKKIMKGVFNNMKFNKESGCTKVWVTLIMNGVYTYDQVPALLNLRECVGEVLKEMGVIEEKEDKETITKSSKK